MVSQRVLIAAAAFLAGAPAGLAGAAEQIHEPRSGTAFPATIELETGDELVGLGAGLREATIMKLDVYAIAAYKPAEIELGEDPGAALVALEGPKQLRMVFLRDIEGQKMRDACEESISKNFGSETGAFAADLAAFLDELPVKFHSGDRLSLCYVPGTGLWAEMDERRIDPIPNPSLARAMWTIWLGDRPVSPGLKQAMLGLED